MTPLDLKLRAIVVSLAHGTTFSPLPTNLASFERALLHRAGGEATRHRAHRFPDHGDGIDVADVAASGGAIAREAPGTKSLVIDLAVVLWRPGEDSALGRGMAEIIRRIGPSASPVRLTGLQSHCRGQNALQESKVSLSDAGADHPHQPHSLSDRASLSPVTPANTDPRRHRC